MCTTCNLCVDLLGELLPLQSHSTHSLCLMVLGINFGCVLIVIFDVAARDIVFASATTIFSLDTVGVGWLTDHRYIVRKVSYAHFSLLDRLKNRFRQELIFCLLQLMVCPLVASRLLLLVLRLAGEDYLFEKAISVHLL